MADNRHTGHRKRLKERFLSGEAEAFSDEVLLELLLSFAIPRKDTKPLAKELIKKFGTLSGVISAPSTELSSIKGLGESSVILLKVVCRILSRNEPTDNLGSLTEKSESTQQILFEDPAMAQRTERKTKQSPESKAAKQKEPEISSIEPVQIRESPGIDEADVSRVDTNNPTNPSKNTAPSKSMSDRKLQVCNGHYLEFDQLARLMHTVNTYPQNTTISMSDLEAETGMPFRQVRNRISIGRAMGLFKENKADLTQLGKLVSLHDTFFESKGTLEYLHYLASGNYKNLIWYDVFNKLLVEENPTDHQGWVIYFRSKLSKDYTEYSIKSHLGTEIRFIIDAYIDKNFRKIEVLQRSADGKLFRRRYIEITPLILTAMVYDFCAINRTNLLQVADMVSMAGSPAMVFGIDVTSFRSQIEEIHRRGWLRYETTHNLDQIRLKPGYNALEFITAYYKTREPIPNSNQSSGDTLV